MARALKRPSKNVSSNHMSYLEEPSTWVPEDLSASFDYMGTMRNVCQYRLRSNGLSIFTSQDPTSNSVSVLVTYNVGSCREIEGRRGITHVLEHMFFRGSQRFNTMTGYSTVAALQGVGGIINGSTNKDNTCMYSVLPSQYLRGVLSVEADRMRAPLLRIDDIDVEKAVVLREIDKINEDPIETLNNSIWSAAYEGHPYAHSYCGIHENVRDITKQRLQEHYQHFYPPNNAAIIVAGDFEIDEVLRVVVAEFASIPPRPVAPYVPASIPVQNECITVTVEHTGDTTVVVGVGFKTPKALHPDNVVMELLGYIMANGKSSRLHRVLVAPTPMLATRVTLNTQSCKEGGMSLVYSYVSAASSAEDVANSIIMEYMKVVEEGVDTSELSIAKQKMLARMAYDRDGPLNTARQINYALYRGSWQLYDSLGIQIAAVTLQDIQRVARDYCNQHKGIIGFLVPKTKTKLPPSLLNTPTPSPSATHLVPRNTTNAIPLSSSTPSNSPSTHEVKRRLGRMGGMGDIGGRGAHKSSSAPLLSYPLSNPVLSLQKTPKPRSISERTKEIQVLPGLYLSIYHPPTDPSKTAPNPPNTTNANDNNTNNNNINNNNNNNNNTNEAVYVYVSMLGGRLFDRIYMLPVLVAYMIGNGGAGGQSKEDIEGLIESLGARMDVTCFDYHIRISIRCLSVHLSTILAILSTRLSSPSLTQKSLMDAKRYVGMELVRIGDSSERRAKEMFLSFLYPSIHPNALASIEKCMDELSRITLADIHRFYSQVYGLGSLHITVVGRWIDENRLVGSLHQGFDGWRMSPAVFSPTSARSVDIPPSLWTKRHLMMNMDGKGSIRVLMGNSLYPIRRSHPAYLPLYIAVYVLGGNFSSRLMTAVRKHHGHTYDIHADVYGVDNECDGYWCVNVSLCPTHFIDAIRVTIKQIREWYDKGLTAEELQTAKETIIGLHTIATATSSGMCSAISCNTTRGLQVGDMDTYEARVRKVTLQQVNDALYKYSGVHTMSMVAVGPLAKVKWEDGWGWEYVLKGV